MSGIRNFITKNSKIAKLRKARNSYTCSYCKQLIEPKQHYYSVTYAGAGLGSIKFPDRVHMDCIWQYLGEGKEG